MRFCILSIPKMIFFKMKNKKTHVSIWKILLTMDLYRRIFMFFKSKESKFLHAHILKLCKKSYGHFFLGIV